MNVLVIRSSFLATAFIIFPLIAVILAEWKGVSILISNHHHFHLLFFVPKWLNLLKFNSNQFAHSIAIIAALDMKSWNRFGNQITIIIVHTNPHRRFPELQKNGGEKIFPLKLIWLTCVHRSWVLMAASRSSGSHYRLRDPIALQHEHLLRLLVAYVHLF